MSSVLRLPASALFAILILAAATAPGHAATSEVTVDGNVYSLSVLPTSYEDNIAAIQATPWWGNAQLANDVLTKHLNDNISPDGNVGNTLAAAAGFVRGGSPPSADIYAYDILGGQVQAYARNNEVNPETVLQVSLPEDGNYVYITSTSVRPVPEIDGASAGRLAFIFGAGWLLLTTRRHWKRGGTVE